MPKTKDDRTWRDVCSYEIKLWIQGITEPVIYSVVKDDYDRVQSVLDDAEPVVKTFICFDTTDGWSVAVRIASVDLAHFLWTPMGCSRQRPVNESGDPDEYPLRVWVDGRSDPYECSPEDFSDLIWCVDVDLGGTFIGVEDEDGETLLINRNRVTLIEGDSDLATMEDDEETEEEETDANA